MRIGLYGLPTAGKTFILDAVRNFEVLAGSSLLKTLAPDFYALTAEEKTHVRKQLAEQLKAKDNFIMDGHYSFGDEVVFTDEDGELYDAFLYLYIDPDILKKRMEDSLTYIVESYFFVANPLKKLQKGGVCKLKFQLLLRSCVKIEKLAISCNMIAVRCKKK